MYIYSVQSTTRTTRCFRCHDRDALAYRYHGKETAPCAAPRYYGELLVWGCQCRSGWGGCGQWWGSDLAIIAQGQGISVLRTDVRKHAVWLVRAAYAYTHDAGTLQPGILR